MEIYNILLLTVFIIFMSLMTWIIIGGLILMPFSGIIVKIEPSCYEYDNSGSLRQMVTWPYMLFKIYKYKKTFPED